MRRSSIILLSGGLDSAANLALCREQDHPILALTACYGQRAADREVEAAREFCKYYDVPHQILDVSWLGKLGGSALTVHSTSVPHVKLDQLDQKTITQKTAEKVWVPNRNGVLIHIAAAYAESLGAKQVVVGFNAEEAATFPDNSADYIQRVTTALALSTSNRVSVFCYTLHKNKVEIVKELKVLPKPFPFEQIWSCYEGGIKPCDQCESCMRLARALKM